MSYADIQSRIADELNRQDLTSQIQVEILSAISHYDVEHAWFNESQSSFSCSSSVAFVAVPVDMVVEGAPFQITVGSVNQNLGKISYEDYLNRQQSVSIGQPTLYAYYQDQFWLYPTPNQNYLLTLPYTKILTTLTGSNTNAWLTYFEDMIRARAKAAVRINYLHEQGALQEQVAFAMRRDDVLSAMEYAAREKFYAYRDQKAMTGRVRATYL